MLKNSDNTLPCICLALDGKVSRDYIDEKFFSSKIQTAKFAIDGCKELNDFLNSTQYVTAILSVIIVTINVLLTFLIDYKSQFIGFQTVTSIAAYVRLY